ncbi:SusD family protein [compost metagenome]
MKATYYFRSLVPFTGLTTSEMYLIQAECLIRRNSIEAGLALLNHLCKHRFNKQASTMMLKAEDVGDAMTIVLDERIRELVFRGLRWFDLRRLNKDPRFKVTLEREYNGNTYRLEPNGKMYCFPIPRTENMYNHLIE